MSPTQEATIAISEIYTSIQGESSFTGLPTTFIRTAGCNMRCRWCDTPHAFGPGAPYSVKQLIEEVDKRSCRRVCITGGEPLLQSNINELMTRLCDEGYAVSLETSGAISIKAVDGRVAVIMDIKCPGSGMEERNLWDNIDALCPHHEVKFVLADKDDYSYAKKICKKYDLFTRISNVLLSAVFNELSLDELARWIIDDNLPVRLNIQTHKFIWPPAMRGV